MSEHQDSVDYQNFKKDSAQREHDRWNKRFDMLNDAATRISETAFKVAIIINGGAAVSTLAFIGGLVSNEVIKIDMLAEITESLFQFAMGVVFSLIGVGLAYLVFYTSAGFVASHRFTFEHPYVEKGKSSNVRSYVYGSFHLLAVFAFIGSLVLFVCGTISVKSAIINMVSVTR
jgi:hypothetical protein